MNVLLIFFALPLATIIISIALQKIFKCPILVSAIVFSIFLIVTFVINNLNFLVAAIVYAIISYLTAIIVCMVCNFLSQIRCSNRIRCGSDRQYGRCGCDDDTNELLTISSSCDSFNNVGRNGVSANVRVLPNEANSGRTGCIRGRYRRC